MISRYIVEIETKPRKFTEKDFDENQDYDFNDLESDMTEQVDRSFHCAFKEFLERQLTDNEDIEDEVINSSGYDDELPIKEFCDLGSVQINISEEKVAVYTTDEEVKKQ